MIYKIFYKGVLTVFLISLLSACSRETRLPDNVFRSYDVVKGQIWKKKELKLQSVHQHDKILGTLAKVITNSSIAKKVVNKVESSIVDNSLPQAPKITVYEYLIKTYKQGDKAVVSMEKKFKVGDKVYVILEDIPGIYLLDE